MSYIDYYKILGLSKTATEEDIKSAYRKLARKHHPDLNPNDPEAVKLFQQINEANEVLSDPEKRKKYDQYGADWKQAEQFEEAKKRGGGSGFTEDYSDFFASMFGNAGGGAGGRRQSKFRGQDIHATLTLNLSSVYHTHQQTFSVNGKNIRITIPAGIEQGQEIKLAGHGGAGVNGGPNGDLYISFEIRNDTVFQRKGNDLYLDHPVSVYKAVLGGEETIETLGGKLKLKIAPLTQNNTRVRLKGKGFPVYKQAGLFGDLYISWQVQLPTRLSEKEKQLFEELAASANKA
ncbi:J domain-containing protein [Flavihumibacter sp. CACIAM 22H1]|uniref:J domain-containing protein n=1 Tax=Flavihumibacter sp. CACIAM 22H1 TaxID=1812911 RepID=UPI0007A844A8|nr:J domain-containing protein [Flavihumibacter sp. CACIAM 22H1]KYP15211.1 MAG: molecular chaperone DnaJ [Flavihumibacter sp. CACIAM 22H1]